MPNGFIYIWTNTVNDKKYIGSHMGTIDDGYIGSGAVFRRALAKYGIDAFRREILEMVENVDRKGLEAREQHYLDLYGAAASNAFYNVRAKAGGGWEHVNSCPILVEANRQRSKKYGKLWGLRRRGIKRRPHSEDEKELRRQASRAWTMEHKARSIHRFRFDGTLDRSYPCINDAAKDVGTSASNILYCAEGRFTHMVGWRWSFDSTPLPPIDRVNTMGKKAVHTPNGVYDKVTDVVKAFGFSSTNQVRQRCLSKDPKWVDWYYLGL